MSKATTTAEVTQAMPEYTILDEDFRLKDNAGEIAIDENFAAQNFWKDVFIRFFSKKSAVLGLVLIILITVMAIFGMSMNSYGYSDQELTQKNFAPRIPVIEKIGIFDGTEKMSTTTGTMEVNYYQEKGLRFYILLWNALTT